ncbi:hypothetical protein C7S16_7184 [Burkholderia thailandensis]|uniref:Uncharacterized protein n=1 Tax=Burkholderia thailandensis TaxID=57975 RepID=A0AAW9CLZ4_BURTH|nr:hypothetical protein [Burkholderia thailandensis]
MNARNVRAEGDRRRRRAHGRGRAGSICVGGRMPPSGPARASSTKRHARRAPRVRTA